MQHSPTGQHSLWICGGSVSVKPASVAGLSRRASSLQEVLQWSISIPTAWGWWYHPYSASHRLPVIIPALQPPCPPLPKFPSLWSPRASCHQHISSSNPNGINKGRIRTVSHLQQPGKGQVPSHVLLGGFFSRLVRTLAVCWCFLGAEGAGEGLPQLPHISIPHMSCVPRSPQL